MSGRSVVCAGDPVRTLENEMRIFAHGSFLMESVFGVGRTDAASSARLLCWEEHYSSGNAGNALRTLAAAGLETHAIGVVGDDTNGRSVRDELQAAGVAVEHLDVQPGAVTRRVVSLVDDDTKQHTFLFCDGSPATYGAPSIPAFAREDTLILDEASPSALYLAAQAAASGACIVFNMSNAKGNVADLAAMATIVVASVALLRGAPRASWSLRDLARFVDEYPEIEVVTTDGAAGCDWRYRGMTRSEPAARVELVSTIGAGDTFTAGIVLARTRGLDAPSTLRLASSLAAACCGSRRSFLTSDEINSAFRTVNPAALRERLAGDIRCEGSQT